jgi:hypothetical protein
MNVDGRRVFCSQELRHKLFHPQRHARITPRHVYEHNSESSCSSSLQFGPTQCDNLILSVLSSSENLRGITFRHPFLRCCGILFHVPRRKEYKQKLDLQIIKGNWLVM